MNNERQLQLVSDDEEEDCATSSGAMRDCMGPDMDDHCSAAVDLHVVSLGLTTQGPKVEGAPLKA